MKETKDEPTEVIISGIELMKLNMDYDPSSRHRLIELYEEYIQELRERKLKELGI